MESKVLKQVTHSIFEFFNVNKPQVVSGTQEHLDSVEIISAKEGPGMREGSWAYMLGPWKPKKMTEWEVHQLAP